MKFRITMKDPDGVYECARDALNKDVSSISDSEERESVRAVREMHLNRLIHEWFNYGEYAEFEVDTDARTVTFLKAKP